MTALCFWLMAFALFALFAWLNQGRLVPIVCQLLVASIAIPALLLGVASPHWQLSAAELLAAPAIEPLYGLCFALLLGYILSDVIDLKVSSASLKIALPSFILPLLTGIACALWLLPGQYSGLSALGLGLLFSITAIPVLYLFLRNIGYDNEACKRLLHAAIIIDVLCWSLFALAQGTGEPLSLLWPLVAALLPLLLRLVRIRQPLCYSLPFFALMVALQQLGFNALIFGIAYMACLAALKQPFVLPLPAPHWQQLMNHFAVPMILIYGVLQVDFSAIAWSDAWAVVGLLLLLPMVSKILGSWLGLHWADPQARAAIKWRESLLLNIRGLTEIVFLNLLLAQHLIDALVYFGLLLMSLISTLLPALLRWQGYRQSVRGSHEHSGH